MNLSDYINLTIEEIALGSKKAGTTLKHMGNGAVFAKGTEFGLEGMAYASGKVSGRQYNRPIINVAFRVNVELQETTESNGEIKGSLKVLSGNIGATKSDTEISSKEFSFAIPILLPYEQ
jgi:hypothetical protein